MEVIMEIILFGDISLRPLQIDDAKDIYNTIDTQREYLGQWLPFVALTTSVEFTRGFVESIVFLPKETSVPTLTIC